MNDEAQLEVRYVPIGDVHPWEKNPKKHNIPAIIASIKRFGLLKPISVQKGTMMVIVKRWEDLTGLKAVRPSPAK